MNFDPALLDALAMTFVEAAVRELETKMQNPTAPAGQRRRFKGWQQAKSRIGISRRDSIIRAATPPHIS